MYKSPFWNISLLLSASFISSPVAAQSSQLLIFTTSIPYGCATPSGSGQFSSDTPRVYAWANFEGATPGDQVRFDWYDPETLKVSSTTVPISFSASVGCAWASIDLAGTANAGKLGTWSVAYYYNDTLRSSASFQLTGVTPPQQQPLRFIPISPCRVADTRNATGPFGGPAMGANVSRDFVLPASACNIPTTALAYSLNVTVVPLGSLGYLSLWPAGQPQPVVSTLNSTDGRTKANAAIVPAGANGAISVLVTNPSHVILDINGYFVPSSGTQNLAFYAVPPCRLSDTRNAVGSFGGPSLSAGVQRVYPVLSGPCGIPASAQAYALNMTVVPNVSLGYLTTWPTGQNVPIVSTLNATTGAITANMAIVPAGTGGAISVFATDRTDLVIDVTGYFAPPGAAGSMDFFTTTPCRISDTRDPVGPFGGPVMSPGETRSFFVPLSSCGIPGTAKAYSLNATVVPQPTLSYLTLWGGGQQPIVSTLNAHDGTIVANAALIPAGVSGEVTAYTTNSSHLILDINGYFK